MKTLPVLAWIFGGALCIQNVDAATALTHIVSDKAAVILEVHDVPSVLREWGQSPWSKTWNDDQVKKFFAPLRANIKEDDWSTKVKEQTGYTLPELLDFATGDAIIVVPDFEFARSAPPKTPPVLIGIDVGSNASKIEALMAKAIKSESDVDETSDFSGVTVHSMKSNPKTPNASETPTVWAIADGKWLISPSKDAVLAAIDALHNGGVSDPWDQSERFARMHKRAGDPHLILTANFESIYSTIHDAVIEKAKAAPNPAFDAEAALKAFGLQDWREIYLTGHLGEDSTDMYFSWSYSQQSGLLKLLTYHDGPVPTPPLASPKCIGLNVLKISLKETFAALEGVLEDFNPAISGMVEGQIRGFDKKLGIDIKRDLLGSVGDTVVLANYAPSEDRTASASIGVPQFDQLLAFSLTDRDTFSKAVAALQNSFGPNADHFFHTREYLGEKIVSFEPPANPAAPAPQRRSVQYAIVNGYVLIGIGSAAPLETAIQCHSGKQPTIWDKPEVKAALAQIPANASSFQYHDVGQNLATVFQSLSTAATLMAQNRAASAAAAAPAQEGDADAANAAPKPVAPAPMVDPSALPDTATLQKYWDYAWGYLVHNSTSMEGQSQVVYPKK